MPRQLRVFLCHASQDKPAVRKMYTYLKQHGVQPWLDREDLLPGQDWEVEIPKAIFTSDVILVCLSKNSVNKEGYIQKEIAFALDKALEKPQGTIFIIPVKLEECDVPDRQKRYQWVDYYRPDGRKRLLMGLSMRAQGLGGEITPIFMDDSKPKTPRPQSPKPEMNQYEKNKEELEKEIPSTLLKEKVEGKSVPRKPFTRILDPSSLASSKTPPSEKSPQQLNTPFSKLNYRWYGMAGIVVLLLIFGGFGLKSLFSQLPVTTVTPTSPELTKTPKPPTSTSKPFTPTLKPSETPNLTPTLGFGSTMVSEIDGMVMVYVPAGEFTMGSDNRYEKEKPAHQVYLDSIWIDQTEVTNSMYAMCVADGNCLPPASTSSYTRDNYYANPDFDNYPVIYVNWNQADTYCKWARRKLPTEAEWEKAARGLGALSYPWGEGVDCNNANYKTSCIGDTTKVGNYPDSASVYGVFDLSGNVWEWTSSLFKPYPYVFVDGREGMDSAENRVIRGGAWDDWWYSAISTYRSDYHPYSASINIGFRCSVLNP